MTQLEQLAINGGPKSVTNSIAPWPLASDEVKAALHDALESNGWGLYDGSYTEELKAKLQQFFDCTHSLLTCSGTMAVELALRGVGVKPDTEVILSAYDFPGNFRAIEAIGARPVLVDVVADGWVIDPVEVRKAVGAYTSAVLVSHLHGQLADIAAVRNAAPVEMPIVEDCCQVPGARLNGQICGSIGDVSTFSFGGSKLLSAGRGGAVLSNEEITIERARLYGARGNDAFPLSQLQAAVLTPQIDQLSDLGSKRQSAVEALSIEIAKNNSAILMRPETQTDSAWYKLPWLLGESVDRETFVSRVRAEGVPLDKGFNGFAKRSSRRCGKVGDLANAKRAANQTVLLHHPALLGSEETRMQIVSGIEKVIGSLDG